MSAATADRNTVMRFGEQYDYPVAATTKIYAGTMVCLNTDGNAVPAADTAGYKLVGIAQAQVDNSAGNAGDLRVTVFRSRHVEMLTAGAAASDVGMPVFVQYDNEVELYNGNVIAGVITEYKSATSVYIDMIPAIEGTLREKTLTLPVTLASIGDADLFSAVDLGIRGVITKITFIASVAASTASKLSTLTTSIGTTALTGGVLSMTTAACNAVGKKLDATAITAANRFKRGDTIKVVGSATTAFIEGSGALVITYL